MHKVMIEIPDGEYCLYAAKKACVMARFMPRYKAYNCRVYNRLLKGGDAPEKCAQCLEYCKRDEEINTWDIQQKCAPSF